MLPSEKETSSCIPTGMHGPTCILWANLIPCALQEDMTNGYVFPDGHLELEAHDRTTIDLPAVQHAFAKVRKTPSWPRSWANFSPLSLYSNRNAWANVHCLGQPNTSLAAGRARARQAHRALPDERGRGADRKLGCIVALRCRSTTLYQIHEYVQCLCV